ncbi:ephrin-B3-like [Salvelinus sp. IW2-2015]|uniref:ephrin-B3-like n=1 Tax=Salvelinus sp. IW2-2015 TaxID=2691554 RepID=UPI0038D3F366
MCGRGEVEGWREEEVEEVGGGGKKVEVGEEVEGLDRAKRFLDDKGYVLYPQIGDRLDLICPSSDPPSQRAPAEYEFYKLYLVSSRDQADRCEVTGAPNLLLTCDKPNNDMRFTIKFQEYSPNLWGHEFKTNADYYIIGE